MRYNSKITGRGPVPDPEVEYDYGYVSPFATAWWFIKAVFWFFVIMLLLGLAIAGGLLVFMGIMMPIMGVK
jgi:hypothetical protein